VAARQQALGAAHPDLAVSLTNLARAVLVLGDARRALTDVLAVERLSIDAVTSRTDHETGLAYFSLAVAVNDLEQLARVLRRLAAVPNVIETRRSH